MNTIGSLSSSQSEDCDVVFDSLALHPATELPRVAEKKSVDFELSDKQKKVLAFALLRPAPIPLWKRILDIGVSLFLLVALSPLLLLIAIWIRHASKGPVFFKQVRLGEMGQDFVIYKFRTLLTQESACEDHQNFVASLVASDEAAAKPDLTHRLIRGGEWLRSTSLDELPQLINILRGEMSLIGPRPEILEWHQYQLWQLRRFEARPGVTGLWQVSGKNKLTFNQMVNKDIEYISTRSVKMDLWILFKTVGVIFRRDNS
jgi:lipopolysaccharide/colanic/teichoic acid biosynthesis glycosyltransferase